MRRIDAFPGFVIKPSVPQMFNPFHGDTRPAAAALPAASPAAAAAALEPIILFPQPRLAPKPVVPPKQVPMVQPRGIDGQRQLYRHPDLPLVGSDGAYWLLVGLDELTSF
jgi:hypothetical protein